MESKDWSDIEYLDTYIQSLDVTVIQKIEPLEKSDRISCWESNTVEPQDIIFDFFASGLDTDAPEQILDSFKNLFILQNDSIDSELEQALYELIVLDREDLFLQTLKHCCYTLIYAWCVAEQLDRIRKLVQLFSCEIDTEDETCLLKQKSRKWLKQFLRTEDFRKISAFSFGDPTKIYPKNWWRRYSYYLLKAQARDFGENRDRREAAKILARKLRRKFKFNLVMYLVYNHLPSSRRKIYQNPTVLNDEVLYLIQKNLVRSGTFNNQNLANLFIKQTEGLCYKSFKTSLLKYLIGLPADGQALPTWLRQNLSDYIDSLYTEYDNWHWNSHLLLRTCNRLLEYFTQPDLDNPSHHLTILAIQKSYLTWTVILLKIILICRKSYNHLVTCIARLIQAYEDKPESECQWLIEFLDTLNVVLAIAFHNPNYNSLGFPRDRAIEDTATIFQTYRILA